MDENKPANQIGIRQRSMEDHLQLVLRTALSHAFGDQSIVSIASVLLDHADKLKQITRRLDALAKQVEYCAAPDKPVSGKYESPPGVDIVAEIRGSDKASAFLSALLKQGNPRSLEAIIRAAVDVVLPPELNSVRRLDLPPGTESPELEIRREFLSLAEQVAKIRPV